MFSNVFKDNGSVHFVASLWMDSENTNSGFTKANFELKKKKIKAYITFKCVPLITLTKSIVPVAFTR